MTTTLRARSTTSKLTAALFPPVSRTTPRTPRLVGNYGGVAGGDTHTTTTVWQPQPRSAARAYASYAFAAATQAATTTSFSSSAPTTSSEFDDDGNEENDTGGDHRGTPVSASLVRLCGYETIDTADTTTNCSSSTAATKIPAATAATYELPSSWLAAETMRDVLNDSYYHASYRATTETTTTAHH